VPDRRLGGVGQDHLLAQWCLADQASRRIAWLSLDDGEDDPVRFWVDLGFTDAEATTLLNQSMGLELTAQQTQRLWEWTEGWAAGLVLAGLSLRGRADPGPFWYQHAGDVEAAIDHAASAGEFAQAGALIARHWLL
jgi:ATP/maltotriose-dependent transcriptional regulator MalT